VLAPKASSAAAKILPEGFIFDLLYDRRGLLRRLCDEIHLLARALNRF
jgi:hypothetical protein